MKKISSKKQKEMLIDMLSYIDKICRDNQINYSAIGGTAIGAIRHKGFIPWDDDIDIILDHDNYIKLKETIINEKNDNYYLLDESNDTNYYPYLKLIDTRTTLIEEGCLPIDDYGLFIDILEYNAAPNNKFKRTIFYYQIQFYKKLVSGLAWSKNRKDHFIILSIRHFISLLIGKKRLIKKYNKVCRKYNNKNNCDYLISNWAIYGKEKEYQLKRNFVEFIDVNFENINIMISKAYDDILRTTFKDYMKIPPVEKRKSHNLIVYYKEEL